MVNKIYVGGGQTGDEGKGAIEYFFTRSLSFVFQFYGGRMHWHGSDWEPFSGGIAKWPENDTRYFGSLMNISWKF